MSFTPHHILQVSSLGFEKQLPTFGGMLISRLWNRSGLLLSPSESPNILHKVKQLQQEELLSWVMGAIPTAGYDEVGAHLLSTSQIQWAVTRFLSQPGIWAQGWN